MSVTKPGNLPLPVKVQYIFTDDVQSFTRYQGVYALIVLKSGKAFSDFYSTPGSIEFSEKAGKRPSGTFYDTKVSLSFPGVNAETEQKFLRLNRTMAILKVFFSDNSVRTVGAPENPVLLLTEITQSNSKSAVQVTTDIQLPEKSPFLVTAGNQIPPEEL